MDANSSSAKSLFEDPSLSPAILGSLKCMVLITDSEGRSIWMNPCASSVLRLGEKPPGSAPMWELFTDPTSSLVKKTFSDLLAGHSHIDFECEIPSSKGSPRVYSCFFNAIKDDKGQIQWVLLLGRDISEVREAQREVLRVQKTQSLSTLASGITHDLQAILTSVITNSTIAQALLPKRHPSNELLTLIQDATQNALGLLDALATYAKSGNAQKAPVSMDQVLSNVIQLVKSVAPSRANISDNVGETLPFVQADPQRLNQALMNICVNAVESLEGKQGEVSVSARQTQIGPDHCVRCKGCSEAKSGAFVCIEVRDNGRGMEAEEKRRACEPYFTTRGQGRGLGLSIAWGIIKDHGGCIAIDSEKGVGTTVKVLLPALAEEAHPPSS